MFTIRATASLFDWFARKTNQPRIYSPLITSIAYNKIDYKLYKNETASFIGTALGSGITYKWYLKACGRDIYYCGGSIPGLAINKNNNWMTITNNTFLNKYTCSFFDSLCSSDNSKEKQNQNDFLEPEPLSFLVGLVATNSAGVDTLEFKVNDVPRFINPTQGIRPGPPPPIGGCPFLFVYNGDSERSIIDNNILHRSENPEFVEMDRRQICLIC